MGFFDKLFGKQTQKTEQDRESGKPTGLEGFAQLNAGDRMGMIMTMGDTGNLKHFPFLKYAIQKDPDMNVRFAALKRIHHFKDHPETISMLTELKNNGEGENYEPYFSMALSRLNIITLQEFEAKLNKK